MNAAVPAFDRPVHIYMLVHSVVNRRATLGHFCSSPFVHLQILPTLSDHLHYFLHAGPHPQSEVAVRFSDLPQRSACVPHAPIPSASHCNHCCLSL